MYSWPVNSLSLHLTAKHYIANKNAIVDVEYRLYVISGMHQKSSDSHIKATFPIKNQTKLQHGTSQNEPRKCIL